MSNYRRILVTDLTIRENRRSIDKSKDLIEKAKAVAKSTKERVKR